MCRHYLSTAIDDIGRTALFWASYEGHWDIVDELLNLHDQVDVNFKGSHGYTVLIWASLQGKLDVVCQLIKRPRLNVNVKNKAWLKALDIARHLEILEILSCLEDHVK